MATIKKKTTVKNLSHLASKGLVYSSAKNKSLVEHKQQQIVDGACKVFFKKGYHPTTIRDIAKACGMSMGQLYHYIQSKDDVLFLVHQQMQKIWYDYLKKANFEKIEDPYQKLTEVLRRSLEFMVENKKLIQFIYTETKYLDKKHLQVVLAMDYNNVIALFRHLLEELQDQKRIKGDVYILSSFITYLLVFFPFRSWTVKDKPISKTIDSLYDFIIRGLGLI